MLVTCYGGFIFPVHSWTQQIPQVGWLKELHAWLDSWVESLLPLRPHTGQTYFLLPTLNFPAEQPVTKVLIFWGKWLDLRGGQSPCLTLLRVTLYVSDYKAGICTVKLNIKCCICCLINRYGCGFSASDNINRSHESNWVSHKEKSRSEILWELLSVLKLAKYSEWIWQSWREECLEKFVVLEVRNDKTPQCYLKDD